MALFRYDPLEFLMVSIFFPFLYLIDFSVALHDDVILLFPFSVDLESLLIVMKE